MSEPLGVTRGADGVRRRVTYGVLAVCVALLAGCSEKNDDTAPADAGVKPEPCVPFVMPTDCTIPMGAVLPGELRCTGLYGDWAKRTLACGVEPYAPTFELWADGAQKQRFVSLPAGTTVDVTEPDNFKYPVGTRFWKEFRLPTATGTRLGETRLMQKSDAGWIYTAYVWSEDETTTVQTNDGVANLHASGHTVPPRTQCKECHAGRPDFILGWDALMLDDANAKGGLTRRSLVEKKLVTWTGKDTGAPSPLEKAVPGDATERAALGYLHANCGISCHNSNAAALGLESGLFMRLDADKLASVQATPLLQTAVARPPSPNAPIMSLSVPATGAFVDLSPTQPERSLILARMKVRNDDAQMPRQGTNAVDPTGIVLVESFILGMTPDKGYPPKAP